MMYKLISRFREPSSYAGLSALAIALGMSTESIGHYGAIAGAVFALIAVICKDPGSDD